MKQNIVIYTPAEDFLYNSDLGPVLALWFVSLIIGAIVSYNLFDWIGLNFRGKGMQLLFWVITAVATFVTHDGIILLLKSV